MRILFKKLSVFLLVISCLMEPFALSVQASDDISGGICPLGANCYTGTLWEYAGSQYAGTEKGARIYIDDYTAKTKCAGKTVTVDNVTAFNPVYDGVVSVSAVKKCLRDSYANLSESEIISATHTSRPLEAKETVVAYAVPIYTKKTVREREISYTLKNGVYVKYVPTGKIRTNTVKILKSVTVEFVYL